MYITDAQVRLLRQKLNEGKTQETAACVAGMSMRSARKWQDGSIPSQRKQPRSWKTRPDPYEGVWESDVVPLLEADDKGVLEATTILEELMRRHPSRFGPGQLRTLQRRVRQWKAVHGPDKEVYFEQVHPPGREAALDFTHATQLEVTIAGQRLKHLLFELVLSSSGWTYVEVCFGETFEALLTGLQNALAKLGGVPEVIRLDNTSAATHDLKHRRGRAYNRRFQEVLDHYGLEATRIEPGKSHQNGVVEQRHRRSKSALRQALLLRGSSQFESVDAYESFVQQVIEDKHNRHVAEKLAEEKARLRPLPSNRLPEYSVFECKVRRWSTIQLRTRIYSVPSRLIGHKVLVRQYADHLEVYFGGHRIESMPRLRGEGQHRIDYRHIISSLVRKPGAFRRYRYREELFPTLTFRRAYDALQVSYGPRADVEYVRILHLAATAMQSAVEQALERVLGSSAPFGYAEVQELVRPRQTVVPQVRIGSVDLAEYDALFSGGVS